MAVLLDNFVLASERIEEEDRMQSSEERRRLQQTKNPLEPILMKLCREYVDDSDLTDKLNKLYRV